MALPSFDTAWRERKSVKPRILVLEIRDQHRPKDAVLGWVVVEREEVYRRDPRSGEIYEASVRLSYQRITAGYPSQSSGKGQFNGSFSRAFHAVSLTSSSMAKGAVFLDLPGLYGQRIGTYLMNEVVQWVQQWPDAEVNSIELLGGQAIGDNKKRRNWFYEQFGLSFEYQDPAHREGFSRPMQAAALLTVETWKANIFEHHMLHFLADRLDAAASARSELEARNQACAYLMAEQKKAEARPLRWAIRRLCIQIVPHMTIVLCLAVFFSLLWFKTR